MQIHNNKQIKKVSLIIEAQQAKVAGEIDFENVISIRQLGIDYLADIADAIFDFAQVTKADSAGVALLIEWWRNATLQKKKIRFVNVPQGMQALIKVGCLEEVIGDCMQ